MSVDSVLYRHWQARAEEAEAEVERLRAERDGAFTRYNALLWQIANDGCVSARVGEGTRECGLPVCGLCRLVHDRDFYRENSAALGHALEIGNAKIEDLRAENERLRKALRHSARELQYIADDDPCDKGHQSGEGRACIALAERILGPMYLWPDEPNLTAQAEEEGRDE